MKTGTGLLNTLKLPDQSNGVITQCELEALQSEREKLFVYRAALLDSTSDLYSLLTIVRDKKVFDFIGNFYDGAVFCSSVVLLSAAVLGFTITAPVAIFTIMGGGLLYNLVESNG